MSLTNTKLRDEQIRLGLGSLIILAAVALAVALYFTRDVMVPFILAVFITNSVAPLVDFLVLRCRLPGWLAVVLTLLVVCVVLALVFLVLAIAVQTIVAVAGEYSQKVADLMAGVFRRLQDWHLKIDEAHAVAALENELPSIITNGVGTVMQLASDGLLIAVFVAFLVAGRNPHLTRSGMYAQIRQTIRSYIVTKTTISAVAGLLVGFILWALGLKYAPLFGLLVFLLNFIPNIGSIVATLLPIPVAVTQFSNLWMIVAVVVLPGIVHVVVGNVIEPRLMGRGLELHPVIVLLALAFWGMLWGVIGMVLAVPMAAVTRLILSHFETTRALGDLMAGQIPGTSLVVPMADAK
jgi:AI-2 transport protein TqsA